MKIGYARVSTPDQNPALQLEALEKAGCEKIYQEKKSAFKERPELIRALEDLRMRRHERAGGRDPALYRLPGHERGQARLPRAVPRPERDV